MELAHITETAGAAPSAASSAPAPSHPRPPASAPPRTLIHFKKNSKHAVSMALAQLGWREVRIKIPHSGAGKRGAKGKRGGTARMAELAVTEGSAAGSTALSGSLPASSPSPSPDAASSSDDADDDEAAAVDDPANADPSPASRAEPLEHARPKVKQPRTIISNLANYSAVQITPMAAALDDDPAAAGLSFSTPLSAPPSWDVAWVDMLADSEYSALGRLHRINQLPQMHKLSKKKFLAMQLNAMAKHEQTEYSFYPRSWVLPLQIEEVKAAFGAQAAGDATAPAIASSASSSSASSPSVSSPVLIVKPDFACEGRGIYLVDRFSSIDLDRGPLVVQEYIPRPLLLASGRKFDLRIYVLILSVAPLSLALFDDGLTRFCTESYTAPAPGSLGTAFQHLTNYAINKKHASFVLNTHESLPDEGSKWTIRTLFSKLAEEGRDMPTLWRDIADLVVKAVLASYGALSHAYRTAIPASTVDTDGGSAFQFLGFDVLLTEAPTAANRKAIRPFLIEINRNCSLKCDTPLDARIKVKAVAQALQLVDPRAPYRLQTKAQKDAEARSLRGMAGPAYREAQLALQQQRVCARLRYEDETMRGFDGGFQRIYPIEGAAVAASASTTAASSAAATAAPSSSAAPPAFASTVRGPLMPLPERAPVYERLMALSVRLHAESLSAKNSKTAPAKKLATTRSGTAAVKSRIAARKTTASTNAATVTDAAAGQPEAAANGES